MYNILSVQTHNIRNIFWQLVNKTADCFNSIVFILVAKISSRKVCEKMENNSMLEKVLLICNRNAELLRLVVATFDSKVAFLRRMRKKNFIIRKSLQKKVCNFLFYLFVVCWHLSCQISIESVRKILICSLNVLMTVLYLKFFSRFQQQVGYFL